MPRTALPPTPASSTDIHGKDGAKQLSSLQMAFELPPAAIHETSSNNSNAYHGSEQQLMRGAKKRTTPESPVSPKDKAPYPIQPSEAVKSRRRSSAATTYREQASFALPPPPTRSRKIIQMKPRPQQQEDKKTTAMAAQAAPPAAAGGKGAGRKSTAASTATGAEASTPASKKKQPSATSAAGRKIARKTAHSLIERRRRSKMNEEFAVLKSMIPACTGEMHKLAILQASIEYLRYLQDCVEKLKAQRESQTPTEATSTSGRNAYHPIPQFQPSQQNPYEDEEDEEQEERDSPDVEMANSAIPSPTFTNRPPSSYQRTYQSPTSPTAPASSSPVMHRSDSNAPSSTADHQRHCSFHSATMSPAVGPGWNMGGGGGGYAHSASGSTLTSPALGPLRERDLDEEATAALLMLNHDRRSHATSTHGAMNKSSTGGTARGMSVKDLLSA